MLKTGLFIVILLGFGSCAPSFHLFNTTNSPCLNQKREANLNGYIGVDHGELQVAVSPVKNLGLFANGYFSSVSSLSAGTKLVEGAIGYYKGISEKWNFDIYGGGGYGERHFYADPTSKWPINYNKQNTYAISNFYAKGFIQTSIFYKYQRLMYGFTLQSALINYDNVHFYEVMAASDHHPNIRIYNYNYSGIGLMNYNLAFTVKYGFKNIKLIAQTATNFRTNNPFIKDITYDAQVPFNTRYIEFNLGIQLSLIMIKRQKLIDKTQSK